MKFLTNKIPSSCDVKLLSTDGAEASTSGLGIMGKKEKSSVICNICIIRMEALSSEKLKPTLL